jgi:hypothetical protein
MTNIVVALGKKVGPRPQQLRQEDENEWSNNNNNAKKNDDYSFVIAVYSVY